LVSFVAFLYALAAHSQGTSKNFLPAAVPVIQAQDSHGSTAATPRHQAGSSLTAQPAPAGATKSWSEVAAQFCCAFSAPQCPPEGGPSMEGSPIVKSMDFRIVPLSNSAKVALIGLGALALLWPRQK
jgi:hypothetical protein